MSESETNLEMLQRLSRLLHEELRVRGFKFALVALGDIEGKGKPGLTVFSNADINQAIAMLERQAEGMRRELQISKADEQQAGHA